MSIKICYLVILLLLFELIYNILTEQPDILTQIAETPSAF